MRRRPRIICEAVARLHAPRRAAAAVTLFRWSCGSASCGPMAASWAAVLAEAPEVLRDAAVGPPRRGASCTATSTTTTSWTSVRGAGSPSTPRACVEERGFDYANLFCNPDIGNTACQARPPPAALCRSCPSAARRSSRRALLMWILAYSGPVGGLDRSATALATRRISTSPSRRSRPGRTGSDLGVVEPQDVGHLVDQVGDREGAVEAPMLRVVMATPHSTT